jgi:hypothetical protein
MDGKFICSTGKTEEKLKNLRDLFSKLTSALESASYSLSETDSTEFILTLFSNLKKRWVK